MSPTIDKSGGFRVIISVNDHLPPHVHVVNGDGEIRIYLGLRPAEPVRGRMTIADSRDAVELVKQKRRAYRDAWNRIHPNRESEER